MPERDKLEPCSILPDSVSRHDFSPWLAKEALLAADPDDQWAKQCKQDVEETRPQGWFTGGWVFGDPGMGKSMGRDYFQMIGRSARKPEIIGFDFSLDSPKAGKKLGKKLKKGKKK